ncbi:alcohol dehydrogenase class IV [Melghirimyces profundicolus]|uniref:Alcohol dehydrogenase class IV n=1 Tax=Melghirimyces profundicolus TaxID=1242148 RepID=A0A2T6C0J7_9BACL|nr:iron-containing alcohol dehydrogenase [Melghirimyces profundicolus]PTX61845.1 alcohol dehydrogenase class IV [Melghirimyces profundicolus]
MKGSAELRMPPAVFYGRGSFAKVGEQAVCLGKKALLISDRVMERNGHVARCRQYLDRAGVSHVSYLDIHSEPTDRYVGEALKRLQEEQCDVIVALGGGSCLDTAKAVAVVAANGGYIGDYTGGKKRIERDPIPLIAVPTTAGTGSEVTSVTVITNTKDDVKMMIKHPAFVPAVAIVDPVLTVSCPPKVTAATGLDALCHAVEAYISRRSHPLTDTLALSAVERIVPNIRKAYENRENLDARENMALAAMQAGVAFSNASVCLVHGMSRPIGALFHVPHGVSNAMLLPAVLEFTRPACVPRLAVIGRIIDRCLEGRSDEEAAEGAISKIKGLCSALDIPNMKAWGIKREKLENALDKMAADALDSGSPEMNPRIPTHGEIVELYRYCYDYSFSNMECTH